MERAGGPQGDPLQAILDARKRALEKATEHLLETSNRDVPRDSGDLADSGDTHVDGDRGTVFYTAEYARAQHERLDWKHPQGGNAKFLEQAMGRERGRLGQIMTDEFKNLFR